MATLTSVATIPCARICLDGAGEKVAGPGISRRGAVWANSACATWSPTKCVSAHDEPPRRDANGPVGK